MVQSVELLLDEATERLVVEDWQLLHLAGLPSQARHTSASNRPHVTLAALPSLDDDAEQRLAAVCREALPMTARLGPLVLLGRDPAVLARLVVANRRLLDVQAEVAAACEVPDDDLAAPDRWLPHVTMARRMPLDQVSRALARLPRRDVPVQFSSVRRWDSDARRTWSLPGSGAGSGGPTP